MYAHVHAWLLHYLYDLLYAPLVSYCLHSPICLPSLLVCGMCHDAYGYICMCSCPVVEGVGRVYS